MKSITLLSLVCALRPSDIAPHSIQLSDSGTKIPNNFSVNDIIFQSDGSMKVTFFGIKNDSSRTGFTILVQPCSIVKLCPVKTLYDYIRITNYNRSFIPSQPVFISLYKPFKALNSSGISIVTREAIEAACLPSSFTPKDFRPTGATVAAEAGFPSELNFAVGRWKT
ncbi:hypothetical protein SNE40_013040 [Patella caerulea]